MKSSGIGGQAVIEGVMMRNRGRYAVAVRKPNGEIDVSVHKCADPAARNAFLRLPLVRGVVAFIDSLKIGMGTLSYSANFVDEEETESKFEKRLNEVSKGHADSIINTITIIFSVLLAMVIFVIVPMLISSFIAPYLNFAHSGFVVSLIEGFSRVFIFVIYILLISQMQDIKRMFMYHGAEHKCINCIEHGRSLTVDNVRRQSKEHKRCGTSFMLNVMIISIIIFMFIDVDDVLVKFLLRIAAIPVIAGISYEFTRLAGNTDNVIVNILSKPGLLMQGLTTKEPDDKMIEVGIAAVEAVFDWEPFVNKIKNETRANRTAEQNHENKKNDSNSENYPKSILNEKKDSAKKNSGKVNKTSGVNAGNTKKTAKDNVNTKSENVKSGNIKKNNDSYTNAVKSVSTEKTNKKENDRKNDRINDRVNDHKNDEIKSEVKPEHKTAPISEEAFKPLEIDISDFFDIKFMGSKETKKRIFVDPAAQAEEKRFVAPVSEQEADDVLAALDKMFVYTGPKTVIEISDDEKYTEIKSGADSEINSGFDSEIDSEIRKEAVIIENAINTGIMARETVAEEIAADEIAADEIMTNEITADEIMAEETVTKEIVTKKAVTEKKTTAGTNQSRSGKKNKKK